MAAALDVVFAFNDIKNNLELVPLKAKQVKLFTVVVIRLYT